MPLDGPGAEWTLVPPRNPHRRPPPPAKPPPPAPEPAASCRPASAIAAEYRRIRSGWEPSPAGVSVRRVVAASACRVDRAVCLGIGTFDPVDGGWEAKRRTYLQLIAFLVIVDELEKIAGKPIPCIYQDPIFSAADREFLAGLGPRHHVVDPPAGSDRVSRDSLLFGVHLYRPVYAMALRSALPAFFVGTGWPVWDQVSLSDETASDLDGLKRMEQSFSKAPFPQDPTCATAFSSTCLYWRLPPSLSTADPGGTSGVKSYTGNFENIHGNASQSAPRNQRQDPLLCRT